VFIVNVPWFLKSNSPQASGQLHFTNIVHKSIFTS